MSFIYLFPLLPYHFLLPLHVPTSIFALLSFTTFLLLIYPFLLKFHIPIHTTHPSPGFSRTPKSLILLSFNPVTHLSSHTFPSPFLDFSLTFIPPYSHLFFSSSITLSLSSLAPFPHFTSPHFLFRLIYPFVTCSSLTFPSNA